MAVARGTLALPVRVVPAERVFLQNGWPLVAMFALYPLWWVVGLGAFIWPLLSVPLLAQLLLTRRARIPPGALTWFLFLGWTLVSAIQLTATSDSMTFAFRLASYAAATVLFLYIVNTSDAEFPTRRIVAALSWMWVFVVIGGFLGMLAPHVSFGTPVEALLPRSFLANRWLHDLVHPTFSQNFGERQLEAAGRIVIRPTAPFAYTNWWGGAFVLLLPFVIVATRTTASVVVRWALSVALVAGIVPFVQSANRGAWLSLMIGALYALVRLALRGERRGAALLLVLLLAASAVVVASPLDELISGRFSDPGSAELRASLYDQSLAAAAASPIVGYGVPLPPPHSAYVLPNVGTQGQIWLVLVSAGVPALLFFVGWMVYAVITSRRRRDPLGTAAHIALVMALVQAPVYGMVPVTMPIFMVSAALVWRSPLPRADAPRRSLAAVT